MPRGYQLGIEALRQIRQLIRQDRLEADKRTRSSQQHSAPGQAVYIAKTGAGGIAALSGTTPGSATVTLYHVTSAGALQSHADQYGAAVTVTAYNLGSVAVSANTYVQLKQESISGTLVVDNTSAAGVKTFCRFTLGAALATTDASKAATITNQYGQGSDHPSTSITVYNLLTHTAGTYVFEGDSGDAGYAEYDSGTNWRITQMECP